MRYLKLGHSDLEFSTGGGGIVGRRVYWTNDATGPQDGVVVAVSSVQTVDVFEGLAFVLLIAWGDTLIQRNATSVELG